MDLLKQTSSPSDYSHYIRRKIGIIVLLFLGVLALGAFALCAGSSKLPPIEILKALIGQSSEKSALVTLGIRLPRITMTIVSGMGLAVAGCVMQGILRNPLAASSTLGVSQGAAFGAAIAIICFGAGTVLSNTSDSVVVTNPYITTICAFIGSMGATLVILGLSRFRKTSPESMVLAGVALSSLFSGGTALLQYFASDVQIAAIVFWTFGDLGRAGWKDIGLVAIIVVLAFIFFCLNSWNYNALESGEQTAKGLGVKVSQLRLIGMSVASLTAASIVSFVGIINFIGLIAPHIMRPIIGNDYRYLLPASALSGALLLLVSDTFARLIIAPVILPIGAITSFLGAPLFLYLLFKGAAKQ